MKIGILAGETSGDLLGASLIKALREHYPNATFEGIGGPAMIAAGFNSLFDIERLSVMGIIEPLKRLPDLLRLRRDVCKHFLLNPPDVFIGIDAPDFNLGVEMKLRKAGIKTVHYVSPSVWAWRLYRVKKIAKAVDLILTLLPFEAKFYEKHHVPVKYVGHPLADQIPLQPNTQAAKKSLGLDEESRYVALLPGSRKQELHHMSEIYLLAAKLVWLQKPQLKFITSLTSQARYDEFYASYQRVAPELPLSCFINRSHAVMEAADAVIVTSGTATLETMLYKKPMVIAYRMPKLIYKLIRWLITAPYSGLPNLLANKLLVPELFQSDANPGAISNLLLAYLERPEKVVALQSKFAELHQSLRTNSSVLAAGAIAKLINN